MDYKLWVSIYAGVVSTVVFIWRLYEFRYDRIGKLRVDNRIVTKFPIYNNYSAGDSKVYLVTTITNVGKNKRLIEIPRYQSDSNIEKEKHFNFISLSEKTNFPLGLEPGEKYEYNVPIESFEDLKSNGISKIKAIIKDTHGKFYYSKWHQL